MSLSATFSSFEARAVVWGMWKRGMQWERWAGWRARGDRRSAWRPSPPPLRVVPIEDPPVETPAVIQRRCQAHGCTTIFATAEIAEQRCPNCRAARRRVPPLEASHCGCAAAMCAGI